MAIWSYSTAVVELPRWSTSSSRSSNSTNPHHKSQTRDDRIRILILWTFPIRIYQFFLPFDRYIDAPVTCYLGDIAVIPHDTIAFVNPENNALELCRLDATMVTLHNLRVLGSSPSHTSWGYFVRTVHPQVQPRGAEAPSHTHPFLFFGHTVLRRLRVRDDVHHAPLHGQESQDANSEL